MKLNFDRTRNVAHLKSAESLAEVETLVMSDEMNVDVTPTGELYGIEFLDANVQLGETLTFENQETGGTIEVLLR